MRPPQPQFSLPTPKYLSLHGSARPFLRRRSAIGLVPSKVIYSTHWDISCTVPLPTLPQTYGSHSNCAQRSINSCVPKWLFSVTPPQWVLTIVGRFSYEPMPSIQWYSSAKQPPGQRSTGIFI